MESQKVPDKLGDSIDYRLLVAIFCVVVSFQILIYALKDSVEVNIVTGVISSVNPPDDHKNLYGKD